MRNQWRKGKKAKEIYKDQNNISGFKFGDKNPMRNPQISNKVREKLIGRKLSEEHKKKMSIALKGKSYEELYGKEKADNLKLQRRKIWLNKRFSEEHKKRLSANKQGININEWKKFISREPYDQKWDDKFKRLIRKRDNQICMVCGIHKEKLNRALDVHHINYNKRLSIPQNCISLCRNCHIKTNNNRKHWINFFQSLLLEKYNYQYKMNFPIIELKEVKTDERKCLVETC